MRILMYFADMVRSDLVKSDLDVKGQELSKVLSEIGGFRFERARTPSPDTPRSLAVLFTSQLPKDNGCATRHTWPGHNLSATHPDLFGLFANANFEIFCQLYQIEISTGRFLPRRSLEKIQVFEDLGKLIQSSVSSHASQLIFIQDNDYHFEVDDRYGHPSAHAAGQRRVAANLRRTLQKYPSGYFDVILIFSDHGCRFINENSSPHHLLDDNRVGVLLHYFEKGRSAIALDAKSLSAKPVGIEDILPTLLSSASIKVPEHLVGHDLFKSGKINRTFFHEDHSTFASDENSTHEHWRVHNGVYDLRLTRDSSSCHHSVQRENCNCHSNLKEARAFLATHSSHWSQAKKPTMNARGAFLENSNKLAPYKNGKKRYKYGVKRVFFHLTSKMALISHRRKSR